MNEFEKEKLEIGLSKFISRHFEMPNDCRNSDQIRFYLNELSFTIKEYESQFKYVPAWAYALLTQYNIAHSRLIKPQIKENTLTAI